MKVVVTAPARRDLREIGRFIAQDNPMRAKSFVRELQASARQLGDMPSGFPVLDGFARQGVRRRAHGTYLIFYQVEGDRVLVLRVLHGARDVKSVLNVFR